MKMKPNILVPFDFSLHAERALAWAVDLCRAVGGGSIRLVHIIDPVAPVAAGRGDAVPPDARDLARAEASLSDVAARVGMPMAVEARIEPHTGAAILEAGARAKSDLIVMSTHGRGVMKRLVLGSVADHVVRHAKCPVVTIRGVE